MIGLFEKKQSVHTNNINIKNIDFNISRIKNIDNKYCKYVSKLYHQYYKIIHQNKKEDIKIELQKYFKKNIIDIKDSTNKINKCNLIISSSHADTYYLLKEKNKSNVEKILVVCFDMHSDTYDTRDKLWKGNVFSKLLKEEIIDSLIIYGVPNYKVKNTMREVSPDIKNKVNIKKNFNIKKDINKIKPTMIFISIDIDCLDTRNSQYSALEYCPMTILSNISKIDFNNYSDDKIATLVRKSIFVKNKFGYSNLYKVGENKLTVKKLIRYIKKIKKYCYKNNISLGFKDCDIYADITEVNGYDYDEKTLNAIVRIANELV